ncbi:hypothetical protein HanIR_Chr17g0867991 [Helianthus annuus]|nr:hypothetical protein HanIR_Chr17g0867991 [Helianthus annuus]
MKTLDLCSNVVGLYMASYSISYTFFFKFLSCDQTKEMGDWAPVIIGVLLFVLLTPGLLFQLPAKSPRRRV